MGLTFPLSRGWRGLATLLDDARYLVPDNREAGLFHPVGNGNLEPICQVGLLLPGPQICAFLERHQVYQLSTIEIAGLMNLQIVPLRARNFTGSAMALAFS